MKYEDRLGMLVGLLCYAGNEIHSRKKLHKLVYLLQEAGENFDQDFIYHNFGVFSPSVAHDLEEAEYTGLLTQEIIGRDNGYTISATEQSEEQAGFYVPLLSENTKRLIDALKDEKPQVLEALSTIVYLSQNHYRGKEIKTKLRELKPKIVAHYSRAFELSRKHYKIII